MISIIHPSRGRAEKSFETLKRWVLEAHGNNFEIIVSLDNNDSTIGHYHDLYQGLPKEFTFQIAENKSAVDAINAGARISQGNIMMVVSDDTDCFDKWDLELTKEVEGKTDWILKTQDGIQPWIITNPILDRTYYNRTGYIYDPDFRHMFCDTWLTVQADISGRKLTSNLMFKHLNDSIKDDVRKRSDATWDEGQRTFIQKLRQTPVEGLRKITDQSMKNWIRNYAKIKL